jgi:two-component system nitrate/nitrite response regulator NarL
MAQKIRVTILDDHQTIIDGYRFRLGNSSRVEVVSAVRHGEELQGTLENHPTDVLLLDVNVPISADNPNHTRSCMSSPCCKNIPASPDHMHTERGLIHAVMEAGASGYSQG